MLLQYYERSEIIKVLWIPKGQNLADPFTKPSPTPALELLMAENRL